MFPATTKVLVVDDMMTMRKIVIKNCKDLGLAEFIEAADGQIAWGKLNEDPSIGLVISDWNMPNCTGLDLLKRVRADGRFKVLPFLLVTAESETSQVKEALACGVDNYLVKPFSPDSFQKKLEDTHVKAMSRAK